jgi:hypothetical protein
MGDPLHKPSKRLRQPRWEPDGLPPFTGLGIDILSGAGHLRYSSKRFRSVLVLLAELPWNGGGEMAEQSAIVHQTATMLSRRSIYGTVRASR